MITERQMKRIRKLPAKARGAAMAKIDWTIDPRSGNSNSSSLFNILSAEVGRLIRDSAHSLIAGRTDDVARLVIAQLAHKHGLRPPHSR